MNILTDFVPVGKRYNNENVKVVYNLHNSAIMNVMLGETRAMSPSTHFEEVHSTHIGDKILRLRRRPSSLFKLFRHTILKLVGKLRR